MLGWAGRREAGGLLVSRLPIIPPGAHRWVWDFNGNFDKPTFTPSIKVEGYNDDSKPFVCHSFVTDGNIQFLPDSTHALAGKTVPLEPF